MGRQKVPRSMLAKIRAFAKSPIATVLLGLLLVSFVFFGIRGAVTTSGVSNDVVKAGSRAAITSDEFKERFNFLKTQLEQQNQQPISVQDAVAHDLDRRVVDELAYSESFAEMMNREGVRPSDQLVVDKLRTIPKFFNQITGQFDKTAYYEFLQKAHLTPAQADAELRDEITQRQFISGMAAGLRSPLVYAAMQAAYLKETRNFKWFVVSPKVLGPPIKPTDAQLNAFIKENATRLTKPELRQLSLVHFSAAALAPTITPSDADIQKRFNFEKDTLSTPEKRSFVQIPVKDPSKGSEIAAKLKGGADPQLLGKTYGVQAVTYTDQPQSGVPDKGIATSAFALKAGETSGVVQGDLGPAVVRLFSVTPGHQATLQDARAKIEAEVRKTAAEEKVYELVQKYDDAHSGGADMAGSAKAVGQAVVTTPPIAVQGVDLQRHSANLPPKVLQAAFSQPQGGESDPIDLGQGEYYVVRVDKVLPPALVTLDEVRPMVTQSYMLRDASTKLQAKAEALAAAITKGQSLDDAAKSVGVAAAEATGVLRNGGGQAYSADLVSRIFLAKPGEVVVGEDTKLGFAVAKLEKVVPADPAALAPLILQQRDQVSKSLFDDIGQATRTAARAMVKPRINYAIARQALGVDPNQLPPSAGGAAQGAPVPGKLAK
jgi:peptidyl-prolyl cis-trans isomerase D